MYYSQEFYRKKDKKSEKTKFAKIRKKMIDFQKLFPPEIGMGGRECNSKRGGKEHHTKKCTTEC